MCSRCNHPRAFLLRQCRNEIEGNHVKNSVDRQKFPAWLFFAVSGWGEWFPKDRREFDPMLAIPAVRLTCIACFSPISQSILTRFWWNFARTIFESRGDYQEIFIKKYYVVQKLDHFRNLTCNKFEFTTSLYKPIKLVKLKFLALKCITCQMV